MNVGHGTYLLWLLGAATPIVVLQWLAFRAVLAREARAVFGAALAVGVYLSFADGFAIRDRVWEFSPELTTGLRAFGVPIEEILFFLLTALLVTQSMAIFTRRENGLRRPQL